MGREIGMDLRNVTLAGRLGVLKVQLDSFFTTYIRGSPMRCFPWCFLGVNPLYNWMEGIFFERKGIWICSYGL